jgi:hypothetical protein
MAELDKLRGFVALALATAFAIWQNYHYFILGALGWALIVAYYPFGWQLPKYAEF